MKKDVGLKHFRNRAVAQLSQYCASISNELAAPSGFVSIAALLRRLDVSVICQPLLAEAIIAKAKDAGEPCVSTTAWVILLDSERYPSWTALLSSETEDNPMPVRLRSTIAHEVAHILTFSADQAKLQFVRTILELKAYDNFVSTLEGIVEESAYHLLVNPSRLVGRLKALGGRVNAKIVFEMAKSLAISRYYYINALRYVAENMSSEFFGVQALKNVAIGFGRWVEGDDFEFLPESFFINFDNNNPPEFVMKIAKSRGSRLSQYPDLTGQRQLFPVENSSPVSAPTCELDVYPAQKGAADYSYFVIRRI